MQITKITPYNINNTNIQHNIKKQPQNFSNNNIAQTKSYLPTTAQYLSFTGGYSLDLAKTIERLDILAQKKSNLYPPSIREWAGMILEEGNKKGETLIDIHKKFYSSLKDCFSIKEVKEKFPEFKDVLSDEDVKFSKDTIFDSIKKGEIEFFDSEEDLSLQLLKLYWGEGFSLNDLKKYTGGKDLYHTIKKLHIPTVDRDYGHILKFSDPQYNERLTREMTEKRLAALDKKAQIEQGEPIYIKRGPLSAEHKQKISEGLRRYYEENPERIYNMSERQKEFYRDNPEKAEELRRVLNKAWNIFGADKIKSALSSFMRKNGEKEFKTGTNPIDLTKKQSMILKNFWHANEWARKSFSKNMKYAWKKVKEENEMSFIINITPERFQKKFFKWAKENNIDTSDMDFKMLYYPHKSELNDTNREKLSTYTRKFIDAVYTPDNDESSKIANSYYLAIINSLIEIKKDLINKPNKIKKELYTMLQFTAVPSLFERDMSCKVLDAQEVQNIYSYLIRTCAEYHNQKVFDIFEQNLNKAYDFIDTYWKNGEPLALPKDTKKLFEF